MKLVLPYVGQNAASLVAADCNRILVDYYWDRNPHLDFPPALLVLSRRQRQRQCDYAVDLIEAANLADFLQETSVSPADRAPFVEWAKNQPGMSSDQLAKAVSNFDQRLLVDPEVRITLDARQILVGLLSRMHQVGAQRVNRRRRPAQKKPVPASGRSRK
jgi:hypothetical protein